MKILLVTLSLLCNIAAADEGMWMPQQLPLIASQLRAAGLQLDTASLTELDQAPMAAIVSLDGCSASFVSKQALVVSNHHCVYGSLAHNSTPEHDILAQGFLAHKLSEELPAEPGSRILVTRQVRLVTAQVITPTVVSLTGRLRSEAIETNQKNLIAVCEQDPGHRCTVSAFYGGLSYYLIKQLEIRDVRLVYAPAEGVGKFGGDTDNWMWPRHTGDFGFLRAYVSRSGKAADYSKDNVPYVPQHYLAPAKDGVKEGDFVMALGYPGRTSRHRLPSEVAFTFDWNYPAFIRNTREKLAIIERSTAARPDARLKYAEQVAYLNNYYKNRQGMLASYADSDVLRRKTQQQAALMAWVQADPARRHSYAEAIEQVEQFIARRDADIRRDFLLDASQPRLLKTARTLYRLAKEREKPDARRKIGFQQRDVARLKSALDGIERAYDGRVDQAVVLNSLTQYAAQPAATRNASFDAVLDIKTDSTPAALEAALLALYDGSRLGDAAERAAWLTRSPAQFKAGKDRFIQAAVALYDSDMQREAAQEEVGGHIQQAYATYMAAKIVFLNSQGDTAYPDANSTLRVTFGRVAGRAQGLDGTAWSAFTSLNGVLAKATGSGEFKAPAAQLAAIRARQFGPYAVAALHSVPVDFLATLDITGGNSGSAVLNAKGELVGLAFDGTLDTIISDWDYNRDTTRSIQVDLRYILWNMRYVDHAERLLDELGVPST